MSVDPRFHHDFTDFMKKSSLSIRSIETPRNVEMYSYKENSIMYSHFIRKRTGLTSNGDVVHSFIEVLNVISNYLLLVTRCIHIDSRKICTLYFLIPTVQERINILASISG